MKKPLIAVAIAAALGVAAYSATNTNNIAEVQHGVEEKLAQQETTNTIVETASTKAVKNDTIVNKVEKPFKELKEGVHYDVLDKPLALPPHNGAIITEFFWLGCGHCQNFEPKVQIWNKMLNEDMKTTIHKVAVPGSARWNMDSKVYFTMKRLGGTSEQVTKMLSLYQKEAQMYKAFPTEERIESFFAEVGLDKVKAMEIFRDNSALADDLRVANEEFAKTNAGGVPAFVVNGKYKLRFDAITSDNDAYEILRALSNKK